MDSKFSMDECPIKFTIDSLSGKWKLDVLWQLQKRPSLRFNELKRRVEGISNVVLKRTLTDLEEQGLLIRTQYDEVPPRVEYCLTPDGKSLSKVFYEMAKWAKERNPDLFTHDAYYHHVLQYYPTLPEDL